MRSTWATPAVWAPSLERAGSVRFSYRSSHGSPLTAMPYCSMALYMEATTEPSSLIWVSQMKSVASPRGSPSTFTAHSMSCWQMAVRRPSGENLGYQIFSNVPSHTLLLVRMVNSPSPTLTIAAKVSPSGETYGSSCHSCPSRRERESTTVFWPISQSQEEIFPIAPPCVVTPLPLGGGNKRLAESETSQSTRGRDRHETAVWAIPVRSSYVGILRTFIGKAFGCSTSEG